MRVVLFLQLEGYLLSLWGTFITIFVQIEGTIHRPSIFHIEMWIPINHHGKVVRIKFLGHKSNDVDMQLYSWYCPQMFLELCLYDCIHVCTSNLHFLASIYCCRTLVHVIHTNYLDWFTFVCISVCWWIYLMVNILMFVTFKPRHFCNKVYVDKRN